MSDSTHTKNGRYQIEEREMAILLVAIHDEIQPERQQRISLLIRAIQNSLANFVNVLIVNRVSNTIKAYINHVQIWIEFRSVNSFDASDNIPQGFQ